MGLRARVKSWFVLLVLVMAARAAIAQSELWEASQISIEKSILVTDARVLNRLEKPTDFGSLLGTVWRFNKTEVEPQNPRWKLKAATPGEFVELVISAADEEQREHAKMPASRRLGAAPKSDRYMDRVFRNWKSPERMRKLKSPDDLRGGPFRLLAITNLMENAGVVDDRGTHDASAMPRALGEMHLVYGLVDQEYERKGQPYPQTWVLSYRLPPLKPVNGGWVADPSRSLHDLMFNRNEWKEQMRAWASLWGGLSFTADYEGELNRILSLILTPDNFIAIRSNTKITDDEFEIREWYMLMTSLQMIPRKPRNEPYPCLSGSREMGRLVDHFWDASRQDLDNFHYSHPGSNNPDQPANGYILPRDNRDPQLPAPGSFSTCGKKPDEMPWEMVKEKDSFTPKGTLIANAPMGRIKNAGPVWRLPESNSEAQRHSFAIRTCTGCHGQEGAAKGFHIFPRLKNEDSRLSDFLKGGPRATFLNKGVTYRYSQLQDRRQWLVDAYNRSAELFDSLQRKDTD